ncbi:MAG TPA: IPT/TIG domain-containing protein [Candidatus Bathyarchaeia archaeon]|nr:IPT/TIG domain-containing protein [Candidatus Bathyarchaeia archaeon]
MSKDRLVTATALTVSLCLIAFAAGAAPTLALGSAEVYPGQTASIDLTLSGGDEPYAGMNAQIVLPAGVTISSVARGSLLTDFTTDWYGNRVMVYSGTDSLDAAQGVLLTLSLDVANNVAANTYSIAFAGSKAVVLNPNHVLANADGSVSVTHSVAGGMLTVHAVVDADGDGLPDDWEDEYLGDADLYGSDDDPDGDGFSNLAEYEGGTDPMDETDVPVTAITLFDVTPKAALVVGGSIITIEGALLNSACQVIVGGQECTGIVYQKAATGTLQAVVPPGVEGPATIRVEDPGAGTSSELTGVFSYTADPFAADLDKTPNVVHQWSADDHTVLHGYLGDTGSITFSTPEDIEVTVPAALRTGYDAGFIIVRSSSVLSETMLGDTVSVPDGMTLCTPVIDIGGLVYEDTGSQTYEIDEPFAEAVTAVFRVTCADESDALSLGWLETHLDEALWPLIADPAPAELSVDVDTVAIDTETNTVTFDLFDFTTYAGLTDAVAAEGEGEGEDDGGPPPPRGGCAGGILSNSEPSSHTLDGGLLLLVFAAAALVARARVGTSYRPKDMPLTAREP